MSRAEHGRRSGHPVKRTGIRHVLVLSALLLAAFAVVSFVRAGAVVSDIPGSAGARTSTSPVGDGRVAASVERIIDGDTIVVVLDGTSERVRLLNIDTPESVDPDREVECLGPEAAEYLERLLPAGSEVMLEFDTERRDRYDRLLAGVFTSDGAFVNGQLASVGFAEFVVFGGNDRFAPDIRAAVEEAQIAGLGIWASPGEC